MSALLALACKCERAGPDSQAALIQQAFEAIHGPKPEQYADVAAHASWLARYNRLQAQLRAEAYESAAIGLIDDNRREWRVQYCKAPKYPGSLTGTTAQVWRRGELCIGKAAPTALAILSAELRARACEVQG